MQINHQKTGQCLICKGAHHHADCPSLAKARAYMQNKPMLNKDIFMGESPAPFVGRFGYPKVNVGLMAPGEIHENVWEYDAPKFWSAENKQIKDVIGYRSSLINSRFKSDIKKPEKMVELAQDVAMASKPVDFEFHLEQKPIFRLQLEGDAAPTGPRAPLLKATLGSNPTIKTKVDKVVSDTDLLATEGISSLYSKGIDETQLQRMLSVGTLGRGQNRKLVPTRWSITATDDTIGKALISRVKDFSVCDATAFFGGYLGNYFLILLIPDVFSYELFEMYAPSPGWSTDHEFYEGRKEYAHNTAGGYYAARLPVLERMLKMKRQGTALVFRFITDAYSNPLGVWVVREAIRKAVTSKPLVFGDKELLIDYAKKLSLKRFGKDLEPMLKESKVLDRVRSQRKLFEF